MIPRIAGQESPEFPRREDSELPIRIATYQCLAETLELQDSNRPILDSESPIQCH